MRAFIALSLPHAIQDSLALLQQTLRGAGADVTWVAPRNLHVTMKFLGEITEEQRQRVEALLRRVASQEAPFLLGLEGVGAFPSMTAPRVLWAGLSAGKDAVLRLARAIEREGAAVPLPKDERPFAAHVTLGRVRSPAHRQALARLLKDPAWQPPQPFRVTTLTLYQSLLRSAGPTYTALADIPLRADVSP